MDEYGTLLPPAHVGEIVVRGATVMQGYANNPTANQHAFAHGWFRSGDQGYSTLTAIYFLPDDLRRSLIGGKIAPEEVEAILMDYPAVAQAVAFAVPHTRLGEDISCGCCVAPACCGY